MSKLIQFNIWQRDPSDNAESFYSCSDINVVDGTPSTWIPGNTVPFYNISTKSEMTLRVFATNSKSKNAEDLESHKIIVEANTAGGTVAMAMGNKINSSSSNVRLGVLQADGTIAPVNSEGGNKEFGNNKHVTAVLERKDFEEPPVPVDPPVAKIEGPTEATSGKALTFDGSKSLNGSGESGRLTYQWQTNWETDAILTNPTLEVIAPTVVLPMNHLVRLTVTDTANGKTHFVTHQFVVKPGDVSEYPAYVVGTPYTAGQKVSNVGNDGVSRNYACKPWPYTGYCSQGNTGNDPYAPGKGWAWESAWDLI